MARIPLTEEMRQIGVTLAAEKRRRQRKDIAARYFREGLPGLSIRVASKHLGCAKATLIRALKENPAG